MPQMPKEPGTVPCSAPGKPHGDDYKVVTEHFAWSPCLRVFLPLYWAPAHQQDLRISLQGGAPALQSALNSNWGGGFPSLCLLSKLYCVVLADLELCPDQALLELTRDT